MKKRGFTLIELLAVILILGIIALIAVPMVNNIIKDSKKDAFKSSVNNVVSAIEDTCQTQQLKGETITTSYTFTNGVVTPTLNIKGKLPSSGTATVDSNCKVAISVTNGLFSATKSPSEDVLNVAEGSVAPTTYTVFANGTAVYFNPVTGAKCTAGQAVSTPGTKTGCMKWYAFNDDGSSSDKIDLILDHNTTALVAWNSSASNTSGPNQVMTQLASDTSTWAGVPTRSDSYSVSNGTSNYTINYSTYKARLIKASEVATITGNTSFVEATTPHTSWFYLDSNNQTQTATTAGASNYKWLFDYTNGCTSYGCNIADSSTSGYWTSTAVPSSTSFAWFVCRNGYLYGTNVDMDIYFGVRPVITILKANL
jgi:type IV pilus assembly protein PilA